MKQLWNFYKQRLTKLEYSPLTFGEALAAFVKDAAEMREQVVWTMHVLDTEKPLSKASHSWNVARSHMSRGIDEVKETYDDLVKNPSDETAQKFSDALDSISFALGEAKSAIWKNRFVKEHMK